MAGPGGASTHFGVLGPLEATRNGVSLTLGGRQQRAVLAILLIRAGAVVTTEQLAEGLWGAALPRGHIQTIHTYLSHLRRALGPDRALLTTGSGGYRLELPSECLDAADFEARVRVARDLLRAGDALACRQALDGALGLWRGEVLADLADYGFAAAYARPLEQLRLTASEMRIEAMLGAGDHAEAIPDLEDLLVRYPLHEEFHAHRIVALYRSGRQGDALEAYTTVRTLLDEELGVSPGPRLQGLHRDVLRQARTLDAPIGRNGTPPPNGTSTLPTGYGSLPTGRSTSDDETSKPHSSQARPTRLRRWVGLGLAATIVATAGGTTYGLLHRTHTLAALPPNSIGSLTADGTLGDAVPVAPNPTAVGVGGGALWALSGSTDRLYRIDAGQHRVAQTIPVGRSPEALGVTAKDVWVANASDGTVSRVSIETDSVVDTIAVGSLPRAIAVGPSGVWVANSGDDTVQRLDPRTGRADPPVVVGGGPSAIAVTRDAVFVANSADRSVLRLDPASGEQVGGPIAVGASPSALAATGADLWVANAGDQSVVRVDLRSMREVARIAVGDGPSSVALVDGKVWVGSRYDGTVSLLDPESNTVVRRYRIGGAPRALSPLGSTVWVGVSPLTAPEHVGGTLRQVLEFVPGPLGIDPERAYGAAHTQRPLRLVYDGLVALSYAGGSEGGLLVPDLATAIPLPTDGGRTYAFTIRPGIRYSDGRTVRASDIARGIRHAVTIDGGYSVASGIIGARACAEKPSACDLSKGVVVDDATGAVTIHLVGPNPDFLMQLTAFGRAAAPGAPTTETHTPLLGTGPYAISSYVPNVSLTLIRNPYFKQWSFAAQPAGYPDRIELTSTSNERAIADVEAGRADLTTMSLRLDAAVSAGFARRNPARFSVIPTLSVGGFLLNSTRPPFDDVRVRRAVNLAVDRRTVLSLSGGKTRATATCQLLPAGVPGHRDYCPYSLDPEQGPLAGADMSRALALVAASGTSGSRVTVTGRSGPGSHAVTAYLVEVLNRLGFRADQTSDWPDTGDFFTLMSGPPRPWQVVQAPAWLADWPTASNFYLNMFTCHRMMGVENPSLYCNKSLDALAERAHLLEATDATRARQLWSEVDRRLTDDAPAVFLLGSTQTVYVSERVGNLQSNALVGPLLSQVWVR